MFSVNLLRYNFSGNLRLELESSATCDVQLERSYLVCFTYPTLAKLTIDLRLTSPNNSLAGSKRKDLHILMLICIPNLQLSCIR